MQGYLSLVLHAHLPFVRHPEHEKFLEESWLFEAVTETYIPLIQFWKAGGATAWTRGSRFRFRRRSARCCSTRCCARVTSGILNGLIDLAEKEIHRTHWDRAFRELAWMYHHKFSLARETWRLRRQSRRRVQKISGRRPHRNHHHRRHARLLPLLANHPPSIRAQIFTARDHYRSCFGRDPRGIWLPECAYVGASKIFAGGEHPLVHPRHARRAARHAAPALRHLRADFHAQRHRRLRARLRFLAAGLEQARRLSRRPALPRFLPRHRLRPRFRLRQTAPAVAGNAGSPA
jgi:hypothetical protein